MKTNLQFYCNKNSKSFTCSRKRFEHFFISLVLFFLAAYLEHEFEIYAFVDQMCVDIASLKLHLLLILNTLNEKFDFIMHWFSFEFYLYETVWVIFTNCVFDAKTYKDNHRCWQKIENFLNKFALSKRQIVLVSKNLN